MPTDIAVDAEGAIVFSGGRMSLASGIDATAQLWPTHLTLFKGEVFTDLDLGIDYQNEVLIKGQRPSVLRHIFTRATLETPGIAAVESMQLSLSPERVLDVTIEAIFDDGSAGTLTLSEQVGD